jgi:hypothetical protein
MEARDYDHDHRLWSIKIPFQYPKGLLVPWNWDKNSGDYKLSMINPIHVERLAPGYPHTNTTCFNIANLSPDKLSPGERRVSEGVRSSIDSFLTIDCDVSPNGQLLVLSSMHYFCILHRDSTFRLFNEHEECVYEGCERERDKERLSIVPVKPGFSHCPSFKEGFSSVVFSHCGEFLLFLTPKTGIHLLDVSGRYHGCLGKEAEVPHGEGKIMMLPGENLFAIYFPGTVHVSIVKIDCEERRFEVVESFIFGKKHAISCIVPYGDSIMAFSSTEKLMLQYRTNYQTGLDEIHEIPTELNPGVKSACVLPNGQIAVYNPNEQRITTITFE